MCVKYNRHSIRLVASHAYKQFSKEVKYLRRFIYNQFSKSSKGALTLNCIIYQYSSPEWSITLLNMLPISSGVG